MTGSSHPMHATTRSSSSLELNDVEKDLFNGHLTPKRNCTPPRSLRTSISPPPSRAHRIKTTSTHHHIEVQDSPSQHAEDAPPNLAAIEAGQAKMQNHLDYFAAHLTQYAKLNAPLSVPAFKTLYRRNQHVHGRHFVIHQHDHPVAGVHYDLRLQINETSSISWAIMYGLPGNANSRRLNRNATETRVHNVWVGGG